MSAGLTTILNLLERELALTFLVMTFLISVGAYRVFSVLLTLLVIANAAGLFLSYKNVNHAGIKFSRILLFVITVLFFLILLADNHVFEETTLPQKIEEHMTWQARQRHGDKNKTAHNETWSEIMKHLKEQAANATRANSTSSP